MKKIICILVLGLMLVGCGNVSQTTAESEKSQQTAERQTTDRQTAEQQIVQDQEVTGSQNEDSQNADEDGETQGTPGQENGKIYTYEDMSITIPASWEAKYIIQDGQNGFSIMQKSSYEKEEGWGFLFSFNKSNEIIDESTGATQIAYTDENVYYIQEPTDVTCWYEDESIVAEYNEMLKEKELIIRSLTVDAENVHYDAREYIIPRSNIKEVPEYILENLPENLLWIARNEIYARHGREFTNSYLSNYFASCSWYTPTVSADAFDESVLSQTEKDNLEKIKAYEDRKAAENAYPQSCQFDKEYSYDLDGDGNEETFELNYREDTQNSIYNVTMVLDADMAMELSSDEAIYFCLNTDEYYITDISPHFDGLEIAVMDYGMSDDLVTHFYAYENGLHYLGAIGGFPFEKDGNPYGFSWPGSVTGTIRTDLIHTCFSYANWYYDYEAKKLRTAEDQVFEMVPTGAHELMKDIPVHIAQNPESSMITMKAQPIFFLETDGLEWIKIKGKDGTEGYIYITDGMIEGVEENPQDIISGLFFAG